MADTLDCRFKIEDTGLNAGLVSVAFWQDGMERFGPDLCSSLNGVLPIDGTTATSVENGHIYRIARNRLLVQSDTDHDLFGKIRSSLADDQAAVSDLSHARTVISMSGWNSPDVLSRCLPIDCCSDGLPVDHYVQTFLQDATVLLHRNSERKYRLMVPTSFAKSVSERLSKRAIKFI